MTSLTVALIGFAGSITPTGAAADPGHAPPPGPERAVTLLTGDRVYVGAGPGGQPRLRIEPGPGRRHVHFLQYVVGRQAVVLPSDAAPLVATGRIDRRLFDVAGLLAQGYGDDRRTDLPVLVRYRDPAARIARSSPAAGVRATRTYRQQPMAALSVPRAAAGEFWRATVTGRGPGAALATGVDTVWLDGKARLSLDRSVPHVGAPAAWDAGYRGTGVPVAVLDTGYDPNHPDLAGAVAKSANFTNDPAGSTDTIGHGTHVAAIAAGRRTPQARYPGVAPEATLLIGKVCAATEESEQGPCPESAILAGMEWAAEQGARVVNLSLGGRPTDGTDPLSAAVNTLTERYGTLFVVAAGNRYPWEPTQQRVSSPAAADAALAVASTGLDDRISDFSNQGPRVRDFAVKPDLAAPGDGIVAARAAGGYLGEHLDERYTRLSGTSMASPHVAGAAALLAQRHPTWRAAELKAALLSTSAAGTNPSVYAQGTGRLDVARAISQPVRSNPGSLSMGFFGWPNSDAKPSTRTVTYHNDGDTPRVLTLSLAVTDSAGAVAAAGRFTVSADRVTVPARGTAAVTVTATVQPDRAGLYGGHLTARDEAGTVVRTAVGVYQEPESFTVTVRGTDRRGARPGPADTAVTVVDLDTGELHQLESADGTARARLPKGRYGIWSWIVTPPTEQEAPTATFAAEPEVALTRDTTIDFDARRANRSTPQVDRRGAVSNGAETIGVFQRVAGQTAYAAISVSGLVTLYALPTAGRVANFGYFGAATLVEPEIQLTAEEPGRFAVPTRYISTTYVPHFVGDQRLGAVDGGTGTPADLARVDVRGRLVLLTLSQPGEIDALPERVANVARAGGTAVQLTTWHTPDLDEPIALPTMSTAGPDGARLRAAAQAGVVRVRLRGLAASPYQYNLVVTEPGRVPPAPIRVTDRALAEVRTSYAAQGVDRAIGTTYTGSTLPVSSWTSPIRIAMPDTRVEYFSTGPIPGGTDPLAWQHGLRHEASNDNAQLWGGPQDAVRGPYRAGRHEERWNAGPFGPCVQADARRGPLIWPTDDMLWVATPLHCDAAPGHAGPSASFGPGVGADSGTTVVRRDGVELGRSDQPGSAALEGPRKAPGRYEVETTATRSAPWTTLTPRTTTRWAFGWPDPDQRPPMLAVRYGMELDDRNRAPRGSEPLTIWVERTPTAAAIAEVRLETSDDDGATWQAATLRRDGDRWIAMMRHRGGVPAVSLRATARDAAGNSVTQEVIRAYAVR